MQNTGALRDILAEDLALTTDVGGAKTEAVLIVLADLAQVMAERIAGDDGRRQVDVVSEAVRELGRRVNAAADALPPVPGWDSAECPACGRPVFESEAHVVRGSNVLHPECV
jgi:hypothetical protein